MSISQQIGHYRIEKKLGGGQMGDVYAARTPQGEPVAVKVLRLQGAHKTELERRFRREASLCTKLRHPNVVAVQDYGLHDGLPFLTMPLLNGGDLDAWLEKVGALAPEVAVAIALDICAGLASAHAESVVHRDLKPANVFMDEQADGTVRAVVCDFGVAKVYDEDGALTASGAVLGTPLYMSPEQLIDAKRVDARCDVWAVGMVLYHALAGRPAFADVRAIADLIVALSENRVPPLQSFAPWVPASLARVVHAALLPLHQRFRSVDAFAHALRAWGPPPVRLTREVLVPLSAERRQAVSTPATLPEHASELGLPSDRTLPLASPKATSLPPPDQGSIGRLIGDRYRLTAKLGDGGMGTVYAARDEKAESGAPVDVAVKLIVASNTDGTEGTRRLLREAKAAARIENEHVTKVFAWGVDASSDAPYLVMERLTGRDLASHLAALGPLEPEIAVRLAVQAAEGLRAAHALGIVHRDIKPSNLFLHEGGDGSVTLKVCDFGIAKQLAHEEAGSTSTEITRTGSLLGSPLYMSPEQARSSKGVDERTDVFSLALTLHEALSGTKPWPGRTSMGELILAVCTEDVPSLSACAPWVAPDLADVIAHGLRRNLQERISSIAAFGQALEPYAARAPLRMADVRAVSEDRRSKVQPRLAIVQTADGVSSDARPTLRSGVSRAVTVLVAAALVGAVGLAVGTVFIGRGPHERSESAPSAVPRVETQLTSRVVVPASASTAPSATPEPIASAVVTASSSDSRTGRSPAPRASGAKPPQPVASVPVVTAPSLGRGNTGTDLPP